VCCLTLFATIVYFTHHCPETQKTTLDWVSVASVCLLVFSVNIGVQPMANLMMSELFPAEVRAVCKVSLTI
jgi:hypothetical protein